MHYLEKIKIYILIFIVGWCSYYVMNNYLGFYINRINKKSVILDHNKRNFFNAFLGGVISTAFYSFYITPKSAITVFIFISLLLHIAIADIATMEIPNIFVLATFILGIISVFTMPGTSLPSRILGMFVVSVPLLFITLLVPGAFGGGDIKLMAACGLFLGTKLTLLSFAFAVLTGGLYGIWLLVMKKKSGKEHFAFGPFLCLGMAAALFIGDRVWDWYAGLLYL